MALHIAVAGCGPAGLSAALFLARAGHRVTLFDQLENPAPIGSGLMLQPTGLAVLDLLGLRARAAAMGARIGRLYGRAQPSGRIVLDVRFAAARRPLSAIAIHRAALFDTLFEAVKGEGIAVETRTRITGYDALSGGRSGLVDAGGHAHGPFDLVVDALGLRSPLSAADGRGRELSYGALWANLDWVEGFDPHALEQRYRRASRMAGVLPIGHAPGHDSRQAAYFWSLRAGDHPAWRAAGLEAWKDEARALWPETAPFLDQITDPEQLTFARYRHATRARPYEPVIAVIGDAAHATSPQLGQGCNMALLDALALARALERHPSPVEALPEYARQRRVHVRFYQALSRVFTPFYQSDSAVLPFIRDRLVSPASRLPLIPRLLAGLVAGLTVRPLALPGDDPFWARLEDATPGAAALSLEGAGP